MHVKLGVLLYTQSKHLCSGSPRGLKEVLLGNVWAHVTRPCFHISGSLLMIVTHARLSCSNSHSHQLYLGKLFQFQRTAAAAALKGEGGWSACHSEVGQTKRN